MIEGAQRTKPGYIYNESGLHPGDSHSEKSIEEAVRLAEQQLYNTKLFTYVYVDYQASKQGWNIQIRLEERWYMYSMPYAALFDRNFNEWRINYDAELRRLIYGLNYTQRNLSGVNDRLAIIALGGFERSLKLGYERPFFVNGDRVLLYGFAEQVNRKRTNYVTKDDILQFVQSDKNLLRTTQLGLGISYRKGFFTFHKLGLLYLGRRINDTLFQLNPTYSTSGQSPFRFTYLNYTFSYDNRDIRGYARRGNLFEVNAGIGSVRSIQEPSLNLRLNYARHFSLGKHVFSAHQAIVQLRNESAWPYHMNNGIGWLQNGLRNHDRYVLESHNFLIQRNSLRMMSKPIHVNFPFIPWEKLSFVDFVLVPKIYFDWAFIPDSGTLKNNTFYHAPGIGLDMVFYDDAVWRFEYGLNDFGEIGFFLNFTTAIQ